MPSLPRSALVCLGTLFLLPACTNDRPDAPATPTSVSLSTAPVTAASCNFPLVRHDAFIYFTGAENVEPAFALIAQMKSAYGASDFATATTRGFDVMSRIESALGTTAIGGTPSNGNTLVNDLARCMSVGTIPTGFDVTAALGPNGLFAVRGAADRLVAKSRGTPVFGAVPLPNTATVTNSWLASAGKRFLLYGFPLATFVTPETYQPGTAFELSTLPAGLTFTPPIVVGECGTFPSNFRLQHTTTTFDAILEDQDVSDICTGVGGGSARGVSGVLHRAIDWVLPQQAYAFGVGGTGGLYSGLSPSGGVTFSPANASMTWIQQPSNGNTSNTTHQIVPAIQLSLVTQNGVPYSYGIVTLSVVGGNGSVHASGAIGHTGTDGRVSFPNFYLNKPGGYVITASVMVGGQPKTLTSVGFHIDSH
jgi:hypothetical protein